MKYATLHVRMMRERARGQKTISLIPSLNFVYQVILFVNFNNDMAELFYREDRDSDFFNTCEQVRSEDINLSVSEIVAKAILRTAKSFYLHRKEYSAIIRKNGKELPKNEVKKLLHLEILKRYKDLKARNPDLKDYEIAHIISEQEAPRFYLSARGAERIYYDMLKKPQSQLYT